MSKRKSILFGRKRRLRTEVSVNNLHSYNDVNLRVMSHCFCFRCFWISSFFSGHFTPHPPTSPPSPSCTGEINVSLFFQLKVWGNISWITSRSGNEYGKMGKHARRVGIICALAAASVRSSSFMSCLQMMKHVQYSICT